MKNHQTTLSFPTSSSLKPCADKQGLSEDRSQYRLTKLGEQMAHLPIDPKIARILLGRVLNLT